MYKSVQIIHKEDEVSTAIAEHIKSKINYIEPEEPDKVISIGGDGTILRSIHEHMDRIDDVIIFGVMTGHLGFYMDFNESMIDELISSIINNTYNIHTFSLAEGLLETGKGKKTFYALNEFQLVKSHKVVAFDLFIDNRKFETFRGNGLCFSTPQGSTGMNKSLDGAIVDPLLESIQVTELASINSNVYRTIGSSMLFSRGRKVQIEPIATMELDFCYDHMMESFKEVKSFSVKLSSKKVKIAYIKDNPFFERVRKAFL